MGTVHAKVPRVASSAQRAELFITGQRDELISCLRGQQARIRGEGGRGRGQRDELISCLRGQQARIRGGGEKGRGLGEGVKGGEGLREGRG
ncbi:Hypp1599 [Branchiostoma lanceolatum]|uniref:Hypp1599 protein n=1 Tax=Branchiostoma lanceolatum TaxID=7740 RepID=A0A8J9ZJC5_BRALA|nr:Hypp1599 [Branchiostoma lanceolatum]